MGDRLLLAKYETKNLSAHCPNVMFVFNVFFAYLNKIENVKYFLSKFHLNEICIFLMEILD